MNRQLDKDDIPIRPVPPSVFYLGRARRSHRIYSFRKPCEALYRKDEREAQKRRGQKP
jgi:hypothetical protein